MVTIDYIIACVQELIKRYGTRNPFELCEALKVIIKYEDFIELKGMYRKLGRNRYIMLKRDLIDCMLAIVCLHELGHDQLHRKLGENKSLRDSVIFGREPIELEANMYAAEVKLIDDDIMELVYSGYTVDQIAMETKTCGDLVAIKLDIMKHKGYPLRDSEYNANFLRVAEAKFIEKDYSPC